MEEFKACRARNRFEAAMLLARLKNAMDFGSAAVEDDQIVGSPLFHYSRGVEGAFYMVVDDHDVGAEVTVFWVGDVSQDYGRCFLEAQRRLSDPAGAQ